MRKGSMGDGMLQTTIESRLAVLTARLPHPLAALLEKALGADNSDALHEDLVNAWEAALKVAACCMWAARREIGVSSSGFEQQCRQLARPSYGTWPGMIREGRALLAGRPEAPARALGPLLAGLDARWDSRPGLAALAAHLRETPGVELSGNTVLGLVQALSNYRNKTKGHKQRNSGVREQGVDALLEGLLDFLEICPLTGECAVVSVRRVELSGGRCAVRIARMRGHGQPVETVEVSQEAGERLAQGQPYLFASPELFIRLFPVAAIDDRQVDAWRLGWIEHQVREPRFSFETYLAGSFHVRLAAEDLVALLGGIAPEVAAELPPEILALEPWRGLLAYEEEHAPVFFGREEDTDHALARLLRDHCLVVCGASGSGKSSLMKAGILPRLRDSYEADGTSLAAAVLVPGTDPVEALRSALRRIEFEGVDPAQWWMLVDREIPRETTAREGQGLSSLAEFAASRGVRIALCVDQLEEVVTSCDSAQERSRFLDLLVGLCSNARSSGAFVMATVRADLIGPLLAHAGFRALMESSGHFLGGLSEERLRRIVQDPLRGRGVPMEAGLAEEIVRDVGAELGSLALLGHVLRTLWEERAAYGNRLTRQAYEAAGRVSGALRRQADNALKEIVELAPPPMSVPSSIAIDQVLLQLAFINEDGSFSRRRTTLSNLADSTGFAPASIRALLKPLVAKRLLILGAVDPDSDVASSECIEIVHDSLLEAWPYYRNLLRDRLQVIRLKQEVEAAARAWKAAGMQSEWWTDDTSQLQRAEELLTRGVLVIGAVERDFLSQCRAKTDRAATAEKKRVRLMAGLISSLVIVGIFGLNQLTKYASVEVDKQKIDVVVDNAWSTCRWAGDMCKKPDATETALDFLLTKTANLGDLLNKIGKDVEDKNVDADWYYKKILEERQAMKDAEKAGAFKPADETKPPTVISEEIARYPGCEKLRPEECFYKGILWGIGEQGMREWLKAITHFRNGCDLGDDYSCARAGWMLFGAALDEEADKFLYLSCAGNSAIGCYRKGTVEYFRDGDASAAVVAFGTSCSLGHQPSCAAWRAIRTKDLRIKEAKPIDKSTESSVSSSCLSKADGLACRWMAELFRMKKQAANVNIYMGEAAEAFKAACENGDASQCRVASIFQLRDEKEDAP